MFQKQNNAPIGGDPLSWGTSLYDRAGQGLLQNHVRRFPVFFQMPRDKVVDEPLQSDLSVSRGSRQDGQFPVQGGGNMQRPTLHARNAMQVFLPVDGRLHGAIFLAGRIMSLPDVPRLFRGQAGASPMISRMRSASIPPRPIRSFTFFPVMICLLGQ